MKQNENTKYVKLGITGASILAAGFLASYILNQTQNIAAAVRVVFNILKPFLYGALIAYLLAPICNRLDAKFMEIFPEASDRQKKYMKFASISISIITAATLVVSLIILILPQLWDSMVKIIRILPARLADVNNMIDQILADQPELQSYFNHFATQIESGLNDMLNMNSSMMQSITGIVNNITVQLIEVFSVFKNMFLGFLIAVYLLASRKLFGAQAKLILYGVFPNKWAKIIEEEVHYADRMFNGFFVGKIVDSAIIGVICFAGTTILGFESALFISVIVGVTNIIPFFGPFIGAVPCTLLLLLGRQPWHALYFVIFVLVLQQFDGNILGPKILGNTTGVSSFWVLFSIILFGGLWGIIGMVIAVPLFGVIYDIFRKLVSRGLRMNKHEEMLDEYENIFHAPQENEHEETGRINKLFKNFLDKSIKKNH